MYAVLIIRTGRSADTLPIPVRSRMVRNQFAREETLLGNTSCRQVKTIRMGYYNDMADDAQQCRHGLSRATKPLLCSCNGHALICFS